MKTLSPTPYAPMVWKSNPSGSAGPLAVRREESQPADGGGVDPMVRQMEELRMFAKTGRMPKARGPQPGEGTRIADGASAPRETDSPLAAEVRRDYRDGLATAQDARNTGLDYLGNLGEGRHTLEDGSRVVIRANDKGDVRVTVRGADGRRTQTKFNTENPDKVLLNESGKDGRKVRQNGSRVTVPGKGSFQTREDGDVVRTAVTGKDMFGNPEVEKTTVKPDGKARKRKIMNVGV